MLGFFANVGASPSICLRKFVKFLFKIAELNLTIENVVVS